RARIATLLPYTTLFVSHDRGSRLVHVTFQKPTQTVGIALYDRRRGIARAQQTAEHGIEFYKDQTRGIDAMADQRFGNRTRAWPELNDRAIRLWIDATRHGTR